MTGNFLKVVEDLFIVTYFSITVEINRKHGDSVVDCFGIKIINELKGQIRHSNGIAEQCFQQVFIGTGDNSSFNIFLLVLEIFGEDDWSAGFLQPRINGKRKFNGLLFFLIGKDVVKEDLFDEIRVKSFISVS